MVPALTSLSQTAEKYAHSETINSTDYTEKYPSSSISQAFPCQVSAKNKYFQFSSSATYVRKGL